MARPSSVLVEVGCIPRREFDKFKAGDRARVECFARGCVPHVSLEGREKVWCGQRLHHYDSTTGLFTFELLRQETLSFSGAFRMGRQ